MEQGEEWKTPPPEDSSTGIVPVPPAPIIKYADLDDSGRIEKADADLFDKVLDGDMSSADPATMAELLKRMDLNQDGAVNELDRRMLDEYLLGNIKAFPVRQIRYGDVNLDGWVNDRDVDKAKEVVRNPGAVHAGNRVAADVDDDGAFTGHDVQILRLYLADILTSLPFKVVPGDLNFDKKYDGEDYALASQILRGGQDYDLLETRLSGTKDEVVRIMALDVNRNGKIGPLLDPFDEAILLDYLKKLIAELPHDIYFGDLDADGKVTDADLTQARSLIEADSVPELASEFLALNVNRDFDDKGKPLTEARVDRLDLTLLELAVEAEQNHFAQGQTTCRYGDLNLDFLVDQRDLALLQSYIQGTALPEDLCLMPAADLDLDGSLSAEDEALLRAKLEGTLEGGHFPGEVGLGD